jgi:hypothetical protein
VGRVRVSILECRDPPDWTVTTDRLGGCRSGVRDGGRALPHLGQLLRDLIGAREHPSLGPGEVLEHICTWHVLLRDTEPRAPSGSVIRHRIKVQGSLRPGDGVSEPRKRRRVGLHGL